MKRDRLFALNRERFGEGPVISWRGRNQRVRDNGGLEHRRRSRQGLT